MTKCRVRSTAGVTYWPALQVYMVYSPELHFALIFLEENADSFRFARNEHVIRYNIRERKSSR